MTFNKDFILVLSDENLLRETIKLELFIKIDYAN